jgi:hypothetical protein
MLLFHIYEGSGIEEIMVKTNRASGVDARCSMQSHGRGKREGAYPRSVGSEVEPTGT